MVQRKVPSKLSIPKTDNLKSEKIPGKFKPPSPRFEDGKSKGTEVKNKIKKSKSFNRVTIESYLKSPDFMKEVPQPGKPPTKEKQRQAPNYMRSTSSFEARKEQSQVNSQASVKSPKKDLKITKPSSNSASLPAKTLARTSSLKRVKTLTKTPSFKPIRAANRKCPQVVLCEDLNSQRKTCSSTLKDSKFPNYLELSRGSTESEGTSLMKVCPYTYCSLNGHRHAPLPPLKSFISVKRRVLKTQKSIKLGCLSPRRTTPSNDQEREILGEMMVEEKTAIPAPQVEENNMDFYIEIFVENKEDGSTIDSGSNEDELELSNDESDSGNDLQSIFGACSEVMKTDVEFFHIGHEEEETNSVKSNEEQGTTENASNQSEMEVHGTDSDSYDMEWEEGQHPADNKDGYDSENSSLFSGNNPSFHNEKIINTSSFDEILVYEGEEVLVQSGDYETEITNKNKDEVYNEPVDDKEPGALLEIEDKYSSEQQEEIYEDYEGAENSPEQAMEEENQSNPTDSLIGLQTNLSMTDGESIEEQTETDNNCQELNNEVIVDEIIADATEIAYSDNPDQFECSAEEKKEAAKQAKTVYTRGSVCSSEDLQNNTINLQITKGNKSEDDLEKERDFNPREPNYLPVTPDPEAEKVDLRHQDLDDRKNAEEWMIDYALQQTVTKLAPARKKKVALLVEAFEKVIPTHHQPRVKHTSSVFTSVRTIQACS